MSVRTALSLPSPSIQIWGEYSINDKTLQKYTTKYYLWTYLVSIFFANLIYLKVFKWLFLILHQIYLTDISSKKKEKLVSFPDNNVEERRKEKGTEPKACPCQSEGRKGWFLLRTAPSPTDQTATVQWCDGAPSKTRGCSAAAPAPGECSVPAPCDCSPPSSSSAASTIARSVPLI